MSDDHGMKVVLTSFFPDLFWDISRDRPVQELPLNFCRRKIIHGFSSLTSHTTISLFNKQAQWEEFSFFIAVLQHFDSFFLTLIVFI